MCLWWVGLDHGMPWRWGRDLTVLVAGSTCEPPVNGFGLPSLALRSWGFCCRTECGPEVNMAKAMQNRLEETLIKALKTVEEIVLFSNTKFSCWDFLRPTLASLSSVWSYHRKHISLFPPLLSCESSMWVEGWGDRERAHACECKERQISYDIAYMKF